MRIYVLGSSHFMKHMVECSDTMKKMGLDGWIHPDYESFYRGENQHIIDRWRKGEEAAIKKERNYLKTHYKHILESDAILIVNDKKGEIPDYIGGNVLIEMGQAYVNDKRIFFLNGMPTGLSYMDE